MCMFLWINYLPLTIIYQQVNQAEKIVTDQQEWDNLLSTLYNI